MDLQRCGVGKAAWSLLLSITLLVSPACAVVPETASVQPTHDAMQAAEILGIKPQVSRLLAYRSTEFSNESTREDAVATRAYVVRKIHWGFIEVRIACNKIERELAYTYDLMQRQQRRQEDVNQYLNLLNFSRLSVLYTLEPYARIHHQFKSSACFTAVSGGAGLALPILGIYYNKFSRARHCAPPKFLAHFIDGGLVDASGLPDVVESYLDSYASGSSATRRQEMFAQWKQRYQVDASNKSSLCSLTDGKGKSLGQLNKRIVLLWSLHTQIQQFDRELFSLLKMVRLTPPGFQTSEEMKAMGFSSGAIEAARLLNIQPLTEELARLNRQNSTSLHKLELETQFLEAVLGGLLEMRIATDKIDGELNYAYDVVLANLLARRGNGLQLNYEANFIQSGAFGSIAGLLYYKDSAKSGDLMFVISGGIGTALAGLALWQMRGGKRKIDTPPNSLVDFFKLREPTSDSFSPLVWDFLNSPAPDSNAGKTRRDYLLEIWQKDKVATVGLKSEKNQRKISAAETEKQDRIAIVRSRISLLSSLKARLESFDSELYDLVVQTNPNTVAHLDGPTGADPQGLNKSAASAVTLLGAQADVDRVLTLKNGGTTGDGGMGLLQNQLSVSGKILAAGLDVRKTVDRVDKEIAKETQALDRMTRQRDLAVNITNNANFFQLNILSMIVDGPLGLSKIPRDTRASNTLNIVSGIMTGGLAGLAFLERPGGLRLSKAEPNMLGSYFGYDTPSESRLSPLMSRFLNSVGPNSSSGLTRREDLMSFWEQMKLLNVNVKRESFRQKVSAIGPTHHFWSERMKLIRNRIEMLYDLRATFDLMGYGLSDLLQSID